MGENFTPLAFTGSVKEFQERYGSRNSYSRMEQAGDRFLLSELEAAFAKNRDGF